MASPGGSALVVRLAALGRWLALGALVGGACGVASAVFLVLLEVVTNVRSHDERLVYALPLAGLVIGLLWERFGARIKAGNNLIIDTLHDEGPEVPLRMAPMVLLGTVSAHLVGASVGREGTAVQMGASLADWLSHRLKLGPELRLQLLAAGVAGGFGSVFGTPIAGTVFGLEFIVLGRLKYEALVPALIASVVGDLVTRSLGVTHAAYRVPEALALSAPLVGKWLLFAVVIAVVTAGFIELTHFLKARGERLVPRLPLRMFLGGVVLVGAWRLVGTSEVLGLGVPTIQRAFEDPALPVTLFALKLAFTALSLGAGFPGGEVTPLFFVGATLGSVLGRALGIPIELGAGVGLAAVFAAASNAPLALSVMAVELLGSAVLPHVVIVAVVAYVLTGHRGIYPAQRLGALKSGHPVAAGTTLESLGKAPR